MAFWKHEISIKRPKTEKYKAEPLTLGEHLRKTRIARHELQKDVAIYLNVSEDTITGWENNRGEPHIHYYPSIFSYLGYVPLRPTDTFAGKLLHFRKANGLSQKKMGKLIGVDASTIASWEQNKSTPRKKSVVHYEQLLEKEHVIVTFDTAPF